MTPTRSRKNAVLRRGEVLKTHPRDGFWGCAVVLSDPHPFDGLRPMCHIGVTPWILQHDFEWSAIADKDLCILEFERGVRTGPGEYRARRDTCIGLYTAKAHPLLPVIGSVDPTRVFRKPLTFEVGDGTDGKYPLCGPVAEHLGSEAVSAWLRVHDPDRWQAERDESGNRYERLSEAIREEEREKRRARRNRKRGA